MLKPQEKKELIRKFNEIKNEVKKLRDQLNDLDKQKEAWFEKKENTSKEILRYVKQIKEFKAKRDFLTKDVQEIKGEREKYNDKIKENINQIRRLEGEKMEIIRKYNIKGDPSKIKEEIDRLELMIETEVLSFEKEKGIMKKIKELKKNYKEAEQVSNVWEKINWLSKETERLRQAADEVHKKIQGKAFSSQEKHEGMIATVKKVEELEEKMNRENKKFIEYKKRFIDVNNKLKEKLSVINELNKKLMEDKEEFMKTREEEKRKKIEDKEKEIEKKIKDRKKITTEDLLVFQQTRED